MNSRTLNGWVFGMTFVMLALFATVLYDISQIVEWIVVWPVALLTGSAVYIVYNIAKDLSLVDWNFHKIDIETKVDLVMFAIVVAFIIIILTILN